MYMHTYVHTHIQRIYTWKEYCDNFIRFTLPLLRDETALLSSTTDVSRNSHVFWPINRYLWLLSLSYKFGRFFSRFSCIPHAYTYTHSYICIYMCKPIYTCTYVCVQTQTHMYASIHKCACVCVYIYKILTMLSFSG